jgi:hypothetical protein
VRQKCPASRTRSPRRRAEKLKWPPGCGVAFAVRATWREQHRR